MTRRNLTVLWALAATMLATAAYGDVTLNPLGGLAPILGTCRTSAVIQARDDFTRCTATYSGRQACTSCQAQFQTYADASRPCTGQDRDNFVQAQNDFLVRENGCAGLVGRAAPRWATPRGCPGGGNCNGNGRCEDGKCVCYDGYVGYACVSREAAQENSLLGNVALRVQAAVDTYLGRTEERCRPGQVLCPNWNSNVLPVLADRRDKCVDTLVQCFTDVEHVSDAVANTVIDLRAHCYRNASWVPYCGLLPGYVRIPSCLGNTTIIANYDANGNAYGNANGNGASGSASGSLRGSTQINVQARVRCPDGSCREDCSRVENHCGGDRPVMCPDGFTCKRNVTECAAVMQWDGCPVGLYPCPSRPRVCVRDRDSCERTVGCPDHLLFCGYRRDRYGITVLGNNRRFEVICATNCSFSEEGNQPSRTVVTVRPHVETHEEVKTRAAVALGTRVRHRVAAVIRAAAGALRDALDANADVNLSIGGTADSAEQYGAFATLHDRGALRSPVVQVESAGPVTFDVSGNNNVSMHIALHEDIQSENCARMMSSLAVYRVDDPSNSGQTPERVGGCIATYVDGRCACVATLTSFSGYVVVDEQGVSNQEDASQNNAAASASGSGHADVNAAGSLKPSMLLAIVFGALLAALGML